MYACWYDDNVINVCTRLTAKGCGVSVEVAGFRGRTKVGGGAVRDTERVEYVQ